jgi:two-component system chemotaxis response regulator CheY
VADGNADARETCRAATSTIGYDVVEASDGREALAKALTQTPALVITALNLPLIDGVALTEILRRDHATTNVPILIVANEGTPEAVNRAYRKGADVVLKTPTPEQILSETRRLIADARVPGKSAAARVTGSRQLTQRTEERIRRGLSKSFTRFETTTPPDAPPELRCPSCDGALEYRHSYIGGVNARNPEQWDEFSCTRSCGTFQYRHRTRKMMKTA